MFHDGSTHIALICFNLKDSLEVFMSCNHDLIYLVSFSVSCSDFMTFSNEYKSMILILFTRRACNVKEIHFKVSGVASKVCYSSLVCTAESVVAQIKNNH